MANITRTRQFIRGSLLMTSPDENGSFKDELHFSDSEESEAVENDDQLGDYSTRMDALLSDDDSSGHHDESDEEFVYEGVDAPQLPAKGYRDQLRDILENELDDDDEPGLEQPIVIAPPSVPDMKLEDLGPTPDDAISERALSNSSMEPSFTVTPPRFSSPPPSGTPSKLGRPFLHPNVSRLRSYTPQNSSAPSTGSFSHSHIFDGGSPSPSHFSSMSRMSSTSNLHALSMSPGKANGNHVPLRGDIFKWTDLRSITHHIYASKAQQKASSILGAPSLGTPTVLAANGFICIGTDEGCVVVYDFRQTLKCICGIGGSGKTVGAVTALALSHDHTYVATGHATGHIQLFELKNPASPVRHVPPTTLSVVMSGRKEGHLEGSRIVSIGFVAGRHTAIVSADEHGLAFYHSLGKVLFVEASDILRILGRYPDQTPRNHDPSVPNFVLGKRRRNRYSILSMMPLPLGTTPHPTDAYNIVAMLTPTKLVVVGLKPSPRTWFKYARQVDEGATWNSRSKSRGTLVWFPSVYMGNQDQKSNGKSQSQPSSMPVLAFSWGNSLHIIKVMESKITQPLQNQRTGKYHDVEVGRIVFEDIGAWTVDEDIVGLQWLNVNQLVIFTPTRIEVYQPPASKPVESVSFQSTTLVSPSLGATIHGDISYQDSVTDVAHSIRVYKGKIFLLGRDKVQVGALLTWADHILSLVQEGDFLKAIDLTRAFYEGSAPGNRNGLPDDPTERKEVIGARILELMAASAQYAFSEERMTDGTHVTPDGRGVDLTDLFEGLVATCCRACIALNDFDFLFEDLFQNYEDNGISRIYLLQLEKFVLSNEIRYVPPRITQKLIALHEEDGRSDQVERIIWHIDPACLDINQSIRICQKHHLYDALIYIYTRALRDYVAPIVELLGSIRKIQQYRKTRLESTAYSEGEEAALEPIILDAYKVYPYLADILSGLTYPSEDPLPYEEALQAKKDIYTFLFFGRSSVWPSGPDGKLVLTADEQGGAEPTYPYTRSLLRFDAESFLHTLDIAFEDSYLNDESRGISRSVIVRILLEILSSGTLPAPDVTFVRIFIARNVPKYPQFLRISPNTLHDILVGLAQDPDDSTREDRQLAAEFLLSVYNPHESDRIIALFESAGFWRILRSWHRHEQKWVPLLSTYLHDPDLHTSEIFLNMDEVLATCTKASKGRLPEEVVQMASEALPQLLRFSITSTAALIDTHFPDLHQRAVNSIGDAADYKQYLYLRHLLGPVTAEDDEYATPVQRPAVSKHVTKPLIRLYVALQCQYHRKQLIDSLRYLPEEQLDWNDIREECELGEAYDAVVWVVDAQEGPQQAISKAVKFEQKLTLRLSLLLSNDDNSVSQDEQDELERDTMILEALGRIGKDICLRRSSLQEQSRVDLEELWFQLLQSQVHCVHKLAGLVSPELDGMKTSTSSSPRLQVLNKLRSLVQETFTALVSISSARRVSFPRLFKRLVGSVPTSSQRGTPYNEVRSILTGMLESYRSDGDMLIMTKHLVDRDLFETIAEAAKERACGWGPTQGICTACRKPLIDLKEKQAAFPTTDGEGSSPAGPSNSGDIVVSRTGTIYHSSCLPSDL
ncbi:hypothetical protein AX16_000748 [Volvariella volvacea WC 439]|nr:hypothetical protein AX16_000748 [Volvariella volvacea WC 439]